MRYQNNATQIRREVFKSIAEYYYKGDLAGAIDKIIYDIVPKEQKNVLRCCIYKERAILKYRIMAALGFAVEEESDESISLAEYAEKALNRKALSEKVLTVLSVACDGCVPSQHLVTNACRGCMARPCALNCPVNAITIENNQAVIDHDKCIDCGKCIKVCPYRAIIRIPVPCEEVCPVGAIKKDEQNKAVIDFDRCISCGKCMLACPFGAVMERSNFIDVLHAIKTGKKVIAMFAPALVGQYKTTIEKIAGALFQLGFFDVMEVALGADVTTETETKEFVERMEQGDHLMTSSCCPSYTDAVKKHIPELERFVSHAKTPMHYCGKMAKEAHPDAVTVFIGPCIAKRYEALRDPLVNYVITFEELDALFAASEIDVLNCEERTLAKRPKSKSRGYATGCGVTTAILQHSDGSVDLKPEYIDGLDRKNILRLKAMAKKSNCNFLEVMGCTGGCVGGPCTITQLSQAKKAVEAVSKEE